MAAGNIKEFAKIGLKIFVQTSTFAYGDQGLRSKALVVLVRQNRSICAPEIYATWYTF
jgi:hypothetical protein